MPRLLTELADRVRAQSISASYAIEALLPQTSVPGVSDQTILKLRHQEEPAEHGAILQ